MGPTCNHRCLYKREAKGMLAEKRRARSNVTMGQALEQHGHKPRDAGHHQRPEEAGYGTCSRAFGVGGIALLTP